MAERNEYMKGRSNAMMFGGAVYVGVVIAATTLFISFVLTAFPADAYLSRLVMTVAGLLIGASMLAFPYALHTWALSGRHRTVTTIAYYIEMVIIAVNTIVSFGSLLAKHTGYVMPEWAILYEPFSVVSIVYTLAAWGTIFLTDPHGAREARKRQFEDDYENAVQEKMLEFLASQEGAEAIETAAADDIAHRIARARNERPHFTRANGRTPVSGLRYPLEVERTREDEPGPGGSFRGRQ